MYPKIFHIWGPLNVNSFGAMIVAGIFVAFWAINRDHIRKKIISCEQLSTLFTLGTIATIIGARIFSLILSPSSIESFVDLIDFWNGGISSLGGIILFLIVVPLYLKKNKISTIKLFDLFSYYIPIIHIFTRIGCFLAGCCHGIETQSSLGIIYTNLECLAPLGIKIHPTQLYSVVALILIFVFMLFAKKYLFNKTGQATTAYLALTSLERFSVDFLRGDRSFIETSFLTIKTISVDQIIALGILIASLLAFLYFTFFKNNKMQKI